MSPHWPGVTTGPDAPRSDADPGPVTTFVHLGMTNDLLMVHNLARPGTKSAVRALGATNMPGTGRPRH